MGEYTTDAPAGIWSEGFRLSALRRAFRAKGSDFGRSGDHFEQRVQTLDAAPRKAWGNLPGDPVFGKFQLTAFLPVPLF